MDCRNAQFYLRLRRQAADELGPEVTVELSRHLAHCSPCAAEASALAGVDRAIGTAMRAVPVPAGLRNRLVARVSEKRGAALRNKVYRYVAVAAALFLTVGLGFGAFRSNRPQLDTRELASRAEVVEDPRAAEQGVSQWLEEQKLPRDLPGVGPQRNGRLDFGLLVHYGTERVRGRDVPVVLFRESDRVPGTEVVPFNPRGFAKVYVFRVDEFDTRAAQSIPMSRLTVDVIRDQPGVVYVVVHTGDINRFCRGWGGSTG